MPNKEKSDVNNDTLEHLRASKGQYTAASHRCKSPASRATIGNNVDMDLINAEEVDWQMESVLETELKEFLSLMVMQEHSLASPPQEEGNHDEALSLGNFSVGTFDWENQFTKEQPPFTAVVKSVRMIKKNDVVLGRGELANNHKGNKEYRARSIKLRPAYRAAKRHERRAIAVQLMRWVHERGGTFLEKDEVTGLWNQVLDEKKVIDKCSHVLREKKRRRKRVYVEA